MAKSKKEQQIKKLDSISSRTNDIQNRLKRIEKLLQCNFDNTQEKIEASKTKPQKNGKATAYYAVAKGRKVGIFESWEECKKYTDQYKGAVFKKFKNKDDALKFIENNSKELTNMNQIDKTKPYAFVDGSFDQKSNLYGYGGFIIESNIKHIIQGCGQDKELIKMRNVAGEILATTEIIKKAISLGITELTIYYDYEGIKNWAIGEWKRNKEGTIQYYDFIQEASEFIKLEFIHTKGHSGIAGNEEADTLAKDAIVLKKQGRL